MINFLLFLSIIAFFSILIASVLMNYTILGNKEKTLDIPLSITEPVLGGDVDTSVTRNHKEKI